MADGTVTSDDILDEIAVTQIANTRHDVATAASSLKDNIHLQAIANEKGFCHSDEVTNQNGRFLDNHLSNVERDLQNRIFETQKEALEAKCAVLTKVADESKYLSNQSRNFEVSVDKQFCEVKEEGYKNTQKILDQMAANKYDAAKDELDETRLELWNLKSASNFALQNQEIANLKNMINSVEQTQKFSSKTVQFGAGNVALPTQTANQG